MKPNEIDEQEDLHAMRIIPALCLSSLIGCILGAVIFAPLLAKVLP